MHRVAVVFVILSVCLLPTVALAQQIGDKIVTIHDAALLAENGFVGGVPRGNILVVKNVKDDWFWVLHANGHETVRGWIHRSNVIPFSQAFDFFNKELKRNPTSSAYCIRGTLWGEKGEFDRAIGDYNQAIRLDPSNAALYDDRGAAWAGKKEHDKAIADFSEAIRLDPQYLAAYTNRSEEWRLKGDYDKALEDAEVAIRIDPRSDSAWDIVAMVYATATDPKHRDGKRAVENAVKACELSGWRDAGMLDTLAAACAEAGDFEAAIHWQTEAVEIVPKAVKGEYQSRLELYKAHKPFRQDPRKP